MATAFGHPWCSSLSSTPHGNITWSSTPHDDITLSSTPYGDSTWSPTSHGDSIWPPTPHGDSTGSPTLSGNTMVTAHYHQHYQNTPSSSWQHIIINTPPVHTMVPALHQHHHVLPWYNCNGWLGVKHQVTYYTIMVTLSTSSCNTMVTALGHQHIR